MHRHGPALVAVAVLLGAAGDAVARTSTAYGGLSSAAYVFTGRANENIFHQGEEHDVHFRVGGLLGIESTRPWYEARAGLFAGALLAARTEGFRLPVAGLDAAGQWRLSRAFTLAASLTGTIEPLTSSRLRSTAVTTTVGKPALLYNPTLELELHPSQRDFLSFIARANAMYLLVAHEDVQDGVHGDDLAAATGVEAEVFYGRLVGVGKTVEAHLVGRLMGAKARTNPPVTALLGALGGYTFERHRLRVHAAGGLAKILRFENSHLWGVEPLLDAELRYQTARLALLSLNASWLIRENAYIGGLPSRFVSVRGAFTQIPSERRLRLALEAGYELNKYGVARVDKGVRDADTMHTVRARGRLYYRLVGNLRLFADAEAAVGFVALARPNACAPLTCADRGFSLRALAGVAFVLADRPRDERLLTEVW